MTQPKNPRAASLPVRHAPMSLGPILHNAFCRHRKQLLVTRDEGFVLHGESKPTLLHCHAPEQSLAALASSAGWWLATIRDGTLALTRLGIEERRHTDIPVSRKTQLAWMSDNELLVCNQSQIYAYALHNTVVWHLSLHDINKDGCDNDTILASRLLAQDAKYIYLQTHTLLGMCVMRVCRITGKLLEEIR